MSLSVEEKVRVARILDELGVPMIEAGFPTSNPKELELFERLARGGTASGCLCVRDDAPPGSRAPKRTPRCGCSRSPGRRSSTIVGKTWGLHLEKVVRVDRDENLRMIARVGRLPRRLGQAGRLRRRALLRRVLRRPRLRDGAACARRWRRAPRPLTMCDTNGATLPHQVAEARPRRVRAGAARAPRSASTPTTTPSARVANSLAAVAEGARHGPGDDERLRRALRQREPDLDRPQPAAEAGLRRACRRWRG